MTTAALQKAGVLKAMSSADLTMALGSVPSDNSRNTSKRKIIQAELDRRQAEMKAVLRSIQGAKPTSTKLPLSESEKANAKKTLAEKTEEYRTLINRYNTPQTINRTIQPESLATPASTAKVQQVLHKVGSNLVPAEVMSVISKIDSSKAPDDIDPVNFSLGVLAMESNFGATKSSNKSSYQGAWQVKKGEDPAKYLNDALYQVGKSTVYTKHHPEISKEVKAYSVYNLGAANAKLVYSDTVPKREAEQKRMIKNILPQLSNAERTKFGYAIGNFGDFDSLTRYKAIKRLYGMYRVSMQNRWQANTAKF